MNISSKNKKTLTILLLLSLILPVLSVLTAFPGPVRASGTGTVVSVSPSSVGPVAVNSFFDVFVRVDNVVNMAAYTGTLSYNTLVLTATAADAEYVSPSGGICAAGCEDISAESINDPLGQVSWEVALTGFPTGFTGSGGMVKITFRVDTKGTSALTPSTTLVDTGFNNIPHKDVAGTFFVNPIKTAPIAVLLPDGSLKINVKEKVTFDGSASHDTNSPAQPITDYGFSVNGAPVQTGAQATYSFSTGTPGTYNVCLVVVNQSGLSSAQDCTAVTVNAIKNPPTAVLLPDGSLKINVKEKVLFDGSQSHDNSNPVQPIIRYTFTVNGNTAQSGTSSSFSFSTGTPGTYNVCLVVVNQSGLSSAQDCTAVTVNAIKNPPTAVLTPAGPVKITRGEKVTFDGSGSHDNSNPLQDIVDYRFTVNGAPVQVGPATTFSFTPTATGPYVVCLTVVNESGGTDTDCTDVQVNEVPKVAPNAVLQCVTPPGLGACPSKVDVKTKILFDGSASSDKNEPPQPIIAYRYTVNGAPAQSGSDPRFSFSTGTPGLYQICLVVMNESQLSSNPSCVTVGVNEVKRPPTAVLTPDSLKIAFKQKALLDGSGSFDNSNPLQNIVDYSFTVNGAAAQSGLNPLFSFTAASPGTYVICLVVKNTSGLPSSEDCSTVVVNEVKRDPTAVLTPDGPIKIIVGEKILFDGSASHDNSNPLQNIVDYRFSVNGAVVQTGPSPTFSFTPIATGAYVVCLTVVNESGGTGTDCTTVNVNEVPKNAPNARLLCQTPLGLADCPSKVDVKTKIFFDGSQSSDKNVPPQPIIRYTYTVNGAPGQSGPDPRFSFTPGIPGLYTVCLTVVNESGLPSSEVCVTVLVNEVKRDPTAVLTPDTVKIDFKLKDTLDGSGSFDNSNPLQNIVDYSFTVNGAPAQSGPSPLFSFTATAPGTYIVCLVVKNESGLSSAEDCSTVVVNEVKRDPTAVLTPDGPIKITRGDKVLFDGSASHDNSNPLQNIVDYRFTVNGAPVQVGPATTFSFTPTATGPYVVCLAVVNESGGTGTDCTDVQVNEVPKVAPNAVLQCVTPLGLGACPSKVDVKTKVLVDGSASSDKNEPAQPIIAYRYTVNGAPAQSGSDPRFSFSTGTPGLYQICLVVANTSQLSSNPSCVTVGVNEVKRPPTAVIVCPGFPGGQCPGKVGVKTIVQFDGSGSHDNSNPLQDITYFWSDSAGGSGAGTTYSFVSFVAGKFVVSLTVCNTSGMCDTAEVSITFNELKRDPTAVLTPDGPIKITRGDKVLFDGSASHDNSNPLQDITQYNFTVNGIVAQFGASPFFSFTPAADGVYVVCLTVVNTSGLIGTDCTDVQVNPPGKVAPNAVLQCVTPLGTCPSKVDVKTKILFDGSASSDKNEPAQPIIRYTYTVNGQTAQSGPDPRFSFSTGTPGGYTVCLTVTNESGLTDTDCTNVTVNPIKAEPTAILTCGIVPTPCFPKIDVKTKEIFDGGRSFDNSNPVQAIVDYSFSVDGAKVQSGPDRLFSFSTGVPGFHTICLVVKNESGLSSAPDCITIAVNEVKRSPTALIVAPFKEDVKVKVTFDGSTSHDNSNPLQSLSYTWTDSAGIVIGTTSTLSMTFNLPGLYTVSLEVCNESGLCDSTSFTIEINAVKRPPTAVIFPATDVKINFKEKVTLDGLDSFDNSNPVQAITTYSFYVDGSLAQSGVDASFSFSPASPGNYLVCLIVTNDSGLDSLRDCIFVDVNAVKLPPTAVLSCLDAAGKGPCPPKVDVKTKILFDGGQSFDNSNPVQAITKYVYRLQGTIAQSGASPTFSFNTGLPGTYTVCLTVVNSSGLESDSVCATVNVNEVKRPPTAIINGPSKVTSGDNVVYSGANSHDNSNPPQTLTYEWLDKTTGIILGNGVEQKITFGPPGTLLLSLTVCNTSNLCDRADILITINERKLPVTADLVPPKGGAAYATESVSFTIRIFTGHPFPDGTLTCTLNFGDGTPAFSGPCVDGQVVTHTYAASGSYTATLTVVDFNNTTATSSESIAVQPEPRFTGGRLSWKHHLTTVAQTFTAKITNPSKYTVSIDLILNITKPDGTTSMVILSGKTILGPGASNTNALYTYNTDMVGKYCFTATLQYRVDVNGDGVDDITGTGPNSKSGCFNRV